MISKGGIDMGKVTVKVSKLGRPSMFSEEIADIICQGIMEGKGLRAICAVDGMPAPSTVYTWLTQYPAFQEQYSRAREVQADGFADEIIHIADTEPDPQVARNRIDARKWLAGKLRPRRYGDRVEVEHSGQVGHAMQVVVNVQAAQPASAIDVTPQAKMLPEGR